jgi:hypothetical protein
LAFDLLSVGVGLSEIRVMNIRVLDYWADLKRARDEVEYKTAKEIQAAREAARRGRGR